MIRSWFSWCVRTVTSSSIDNHLLGTWRFSWPSWADVYTIQLETASGSCRGRSFKREGGVAPCGGGKEEDGSIPNAEASRAFKQSGIMSIPSCICQSTFANTCPLLGLFYWLVLRVRTKIKQRETSRVLEISLMDGLWTRASGNSYGRQWNMFLGLAVKKKKYIYI